ncbi:MAG: hypothetical protein GXP27_18560 [Planctomycetes bacterium]|nr:hypothetical protein [Planctomycetota bacterium]
MPRWFRHVGNFASSAYRRARRIAIFVIGMTTVLIGIALLVLPGPAVVVIPIGLGILALEFAWARRWLKRMRSTVEWAAGINGGKPHGPGSHEKESPEIPPDQG